MKNAKDKKPPVVDPLEFKPQYTLNEFFLLWGQRFCALLSFTAVCALAIGSKGCQTFTYPINPGERIVLMEVTAYDSGQKSCNWKYDANGRPVIASGPDAGKPKIIGQTASGEQASKGTIAADTRYYPFGTIMHVPGYGYGVVQDRGGDIKGPHRIDLWYPSEREALKWGRRKNVSVTVRKP